MTRNIAIAVKTLWAIWERSSRLAAQSSKKPGALHIQSAHIPKSTSETSNRSDAWKYAGDYGVIAWNGRCLLKCLQFLWKSTQYVHFDNFSW